MESRSRTGVLSRGPGLGGGLFEVCGRDGFVSSTATDPTMEGELAVLLCFLCVLARGVEIPG